MTLDIFDRNQLFLIFNSEYTNELEMTWNSLTELDVVKLTMM